MKGLLEGLFALIRREPAMTIGLLAAALTLAAAFGLSLGDQKQAAVMAFAQAIVALIIRSQVSPAV